MYLCVNSDKAWEQGLAGAAVAEQLCINMGLPHKKATVVNSLEGLKFSPTTIILDYRELNELTKFAMWCPEEVGYKCFRFIREDKVTGQLNKVRVQQLTECLWKWRGNFQIDVLYVPDGCCISN